MLVENIILRRLCLPWISDTIQPRDLTHCDPGSHKMYIGRMPRCVVSIPATESVTSFPGY